MKSDEKKECICGGADPTSVMRYAILCPVCDGAPPMPKLPHGIKGTRRKLRDIQATTAAAVKAAMEAAMEKIDAQADKITALEKIIVGERAEALYYIEKYITLSPQPIPFRDLSEDEQTKYCVQALKALGL